MLDALIPTIVVVMLILANGFFVAAEFAIVGAPRPAIEHRSHWLSPAGAERQLTVAATSKPVQLEVDLSKP